MGIFQNIRNSLARFMYGRNGVDKLGLHLVWAALITELLSSLLLRHHQVTASLLYYVSLAVMIYALFRMFSKNLGKRRAENQKYLNWIWRLKSRAQGAKARHADKDHRYFTCKNCGTICRVPVGKGNIVITCPKCGAEIRGKS